uniref:NADH dehydrogenase subunit 6 n=1 Tax=Setaphyes kielensis TaxID=3298910 RepID=A0A1I9VTT8_9BILA|nr:NADH dehydrogenase subunit 6 [Pycnophyes kielensis]APA17411.1 NADH dehydrogenase subunit 6 [Pycnophyes kielensis]
MLNLFLFSWLMLMSALFFTFYLGVYEGLWSCMLMTVGISFFISLFMEAWYSFSMFLVIMGGLLVLFMYVSSVVSSMKFDVFYSFLMSLMISIMMLMIFLSESSLEVLEEGSFMSLYYLKFFFISIFFFVFLLFYLLIVSLMVGEFWGPMRKVFYF